VLAPVVSNTDRDPVSDGSASINAINMNAAAAPIVIFAKRLAVPRGPNAVLESELENKAPASALPGCSRITTTKTTHDRINKPYRMYVNNIELLKAGFELCTLYFVLCALCFELCSWYFDL